MRRLAGFANIRADIALLIKALLVACAVIAGLLVGEIAAAAWRAASLAVAATVAGFVGVIWYIVADLRRAFRRQEARRARLAEACGLRREDLL